MQGHLKTKSTSILCTAPLASEIIASEFFLAIMHISIIEFLMWIFVSLHLHSADVP